MLQLTKRTEYGLIALVHLVDRPGTFVSVREICEHYPVPRRLMAEVLKELGHARMVESQRGKSGGYALTRPAEEITLGEIVAALEGAPGLTSCRAHAAPTVSECEVKASCPIRSPIDRVRQHVWSVMERTTLRSLTTSPELESTRS